jgi:hypothetical protein
MLGGDRFSMEDFMSPIALYRTRFIMLGLMMMFVFLAQNLDAQQTLKGIVRGKVVASIIGYVPQNVTMHITDTKANTIMFRLKLQNIQLSTVDIEGNGQRACVPLGFMAVRESAISLRDNNRLIPFFHFYPR